MTDQSQSAREMVDLADEFEGEAKAHRAMGDKAEAAKCLRAAYALRRLAAQAAPGGPVGEPQAPRSHVIAALEQEEAARKSAGLLSSQLVQAASRKECDTYSATLLLHASQLIDRVIVWPAAPLPRLSDEATKPAPVQTAPHSSDERLPSSDAAGAGAGTRSSDESAMARALELLEDRPAAALRALVIEECAKILDNAAQDWNRIRDPGMANNARSYAKQIRALLQTESKSPLVRGDYHDAERA